MQVFNIEEMIVFEDNEIIVCRKPAGMAVQNARMGVMDMENGLKNYLAKKERGKIPYLGIVHRLDQPVEGILVFAKTKEAAARLSKQMTAGNMAKRYLAVTGGIRKEEGGILEDYLKKDARMNTSSVVNEKTQGAKKARLTYKILDTCKEDKLPSQNKSLVYICLETGRHHQIRVQMAHAGMPLAGDRKYNAEEKTVLPLGLCSFQLGFKHPKTGKNMSFEIFPSGDAFAGFDYEKIKEFI